MNGTLLVVAEVVRGLNEPSLLFDHNLNLVEANAAFSDLCGVRSRHLRAGDRSPFDLLRSECEDPRAWAREALQRRLAVRLAELNVFTLAGRALRVHQSFIPIDDPEGAQVGLLVTYRNVTDESRLQDHFRQLLGREKQRAEALETAVEARTKDLLAALEQVTHLSRIDPLTGVLNRRSFTEQADRALRLAERGDREAGLILLDLDHFKRINDRHGHLAGDRALKVVADAFKRALPSTEILGRFGGEEFVAIMLDASAEELREAANRCCEAIRTLPFQDIVPGGTGRLTVSIGVVGFPADARDLDELIQRADQALYAAKEAGRDRVRLYTRGLGRDMQFAHDEGIAIVADEIETAGDAAARHHLGCHQAQGYRFGHPRRSRHARSGRARQPRRAASLPQSDSATQVSSTNGRYLTTQRAPMDSVNAVNRSEQYRASPAPVTYVCSQPDAPGDLARTLLRTLGKVALTKSLREIKDHQPCALAVIHYDTLSASDRQELIDGTSIHLRRPTLLLSGSLSPGEFKDLFSSGTLTNVLALSGSLVDVSDLLVTAQKFLRGDIFGLEKYFGWGVEPLLVRVRGSDCKRTALEAIVAHAASRGVARRLIAGLRVVADEFLTNALYNAPVDSDGARRFASWPRTRPVQLAAHEWIDVRYCCDGRRFGLSVGDPFGSLAPARLQDNLARAFRRGEDQVREGDGGAGLGFYQILDSLSHLIVNIEPGVRTEMIGLLDVSGGYRAFASAAKSFNIFETEGAR